MVDPLTDITSHGDHSHEEFSKGNSGLDWVFDPDLPMNNEDDKWYTHTQNWSNGVAQDSRFSNAAEFDWFTLATTEESVDDRGNKTHRSWVDITNFYWLNRFTKDIYMIYNLGVDNGPIIANNAHLTKMTIMYLAADDWEHGLYTHEMIQKRGYVLRMETTHGVDINIGLIATEAFGDSGTDITVNTKSVFLRRTSSSAPTFFLRPYDQNPHAHPTIIHGHEHISQRHAPSINTMKVDIPERIANQLPGYFEVMYTTDDVPSSMIEGFNNSVELDKPMFDANLELTDIKEFYYAHYTLPTEYWVMATTFTHPVTNRIQSITGMKIIRPRYGHKYYNDMSKTFFSEGGFILEMSYNDVDTLTAEHCIFQFLPKTPDAFYIRKMNNSFIQFIALPTLN